MHLDDLNSIINLFGAENVLICGELADFYWLSKEPKSFDFKIKEQYFIDCFGINDLPVTICKNKFNLILSRSKTEKNFYSGRFNKSKVNIFPHDNISQQQSVDGDKLGLSCQVFVQDPASRASDLRRIKEISLVGYKNDIINKKITDAQETLDLYRQQFPQIFKIQYAIRK